MADQAGGNGVRRPPAVVTAPNSASASAAVTVGADVPIPASPCYVERVLKHNLCAEPIMFTENHNGVWVRPELTPSLRRAWGPIDVEAYFTWCTLRETELEVARASLASTSVPTIMTNPPSSSPNDSKPIVPLSSTTAPASTSTAIVGPSAPMAAGKTKPASPQSASSSSHLQHVALRTQYSRDPRKWRHHQMNVLSLRVRLYNSYRIADSLILKYMPVDLI